MQFAILLYSLRTHVVRYPRLVPVLAHCTRELTIAPELSSPKLTLHLRTTLEHTTHSQTLEQRHQFDDAILRNRLHQKVDVVGVTSDL